MIIGAVDTVESRACPHSGNAQTAFTRKHGRIALKLWKFPTHAFNTQRDAMLPIEPYLSDPTGFTGEEQDCSPLHTPQLILGSTGTQFAITLGAIWQILKL